MSVPPIVFEVNPNNNKPRVLVLFCFDALSYTSIVRAVSVGFTFLRCCDIIK